MRITKTLIFLIVMAIGNHLMVYGADETPSQSLTPKIDQVLVYQNQARITRQVVIQLPQGSNQLVLEGFPLEMNQQSLQVVGRGHAMIREVTVKLAPPVTMSDATVTELFTRRKKLQRDLQELDAQLEHLNQEKELLNEITEKLIERLNKDRSVSIDPVVWGNILTFNRQRADQLTTQERKMTEQKETLNTTLAPRERQLASLDKNQRTSKLNVVVMAEMERAGTLDLQLSYIQEGPSWSPVYDLYFNSKTKKVALRYGAVIHQETGEDWSKISLSLSTAQPQEGSAHPDIRPWNVALMERQNVVAPAAKPYGADAKENTYSTSGVNIMPLKRSESC